MDYAENFAAAETELREAILLEFIKPELPATIVLLRYSERYVMKIFDARAAQKLEKMPRDEYESYLRGMVKSLPVWFFGCPYSTIPVESFPHLGSPWGRCIEYGLVARVDHSDLPGTDDEILKRYSVTNGHLFLNYALQTRADFWRSRADDQIYLGALKPVTRICVDDRHRFCVDQFNKIRQTTTVDKWLQIHRGISRTQFHDYLAGRIKGKISTLKRAEIETAILNARQ